MSINNGATCMVGALSLSASVDATAARELDDAAIGAVTAYSLKTTKDSWGSAAGSLEQRVVERNDITKEGGKAPLQVGSAIGDDGDPIISISGDIPLAFEGRTFGLTAPDETALGLILSSGLARVLRTPGTSATATEVTANTFAVANADNGKFAAGDVVAVVQANGTLRFVKLVQRVVGGSTTTYATLEPHGIADTLTATVRACHMFYSPVDNEPDGDALVVQLAPKDELHTIVAVGTQMAEFTAVSDDSVGVGFGATLRVPDGEYRDEAVITPTTPLYIGGAGAKALRTRVSPVLVTADVSASSAPVTTTTAVFPVRKWDVKISVRLVPTEDPGTRSGLSGMRVSVASLTGTVTQGAPTTGVDFRTVVRASRKHALTLTAAGANAAGNGFCVWIGAVEPTADTPVKFSEEDRTQEVPFAAGDTAYAVGSTEYLNTPWILAFVC